MTHYTASRYNVHDSIGYLMRRGHSMIRERIEESFATAGISFVQWATLILVRDNPALTPGDLCRDLRHDSGAFTRLLDHLEERDLLRRVRSEADRRSVHLRLTPAGLEMVNSRLALVVDCLNDALRGFSTAEVKLLTSLLVRMIANLERDDATEAPGSRT